MASPAPMELSLTERNHFLLRKLHSLTGIIPVGAFLFEHLLTNSRAMNWFGGGPAAFNEDVHWIHNLPYLLIIEIVFIFAPLAFHAGYGVIIALSAHPNASQYPYMPNRRYTLQRITAWITLIFIVVHLLKFRFAHWVGWNSTWPAGADGTHVGFVGAEDPFYLTWLGFHAWQPFGYEVAPAAVMAFYVVGLWAAVYHFCNGIWTFCISWGITVGARAQQRVGYACVALAALLLTWGHASLYTFNKTERHEARTTTEHLAAGQR
ncbi:MAG: succinate dehydrogenase [Phycisphaerae bacterium]|nr:succinate dehydrogenase [Phycisphaerae bacterium]NUQ45471.1 succinate dehydrogenase [Phycisphaerae bacterium]